MNSFVAELRRRNVFSVTAGYAVVAWLLMQLGVVLESSLHLPIWFDTVITVLVLVGFPVAVLLAWIFQFTSSGVIRTLKNPDIGKQLHHKHTIIIFSLTSIIMLGLVAVMWQHLGKTDFIESEPEATTASVVASKKAPTVKENASAATQSIAVLPFDDFSASNDQTYFGRGISEELLNVLSRVKGLRVVSRTSSFAFTDKSATVGAIADALQVAHILEGSVRKSGNTIRITAQLINAQTDEHIWSETYDRSLSTENLFAVQDEIAGAIVQKLKGKLTVVPLEASNKTLSLQAYELYLQARENQKLRSPNSLALAVEGYMQVIDLDPNFAHAYSGLSETYLLMASYAGLDNKTAQSKASPLLARALELAPDSAEVLANAAFLASKQNTPISIKQAEQYARQAIQANQNYSYAYFILADVLWAQGNLAGAIENYKEARTLDPMSAVVLDNLARSQLFVGDHASALSVGEDLIRLHPSLPFGYLVLSDLAFKVGDYAKVHALLQDAYVLNQESTRIKNNLRRVYNLTGLYQHALWYQNDAASQVWYAIYNNDAALAASELAKVSDIVDVGWFLYYLRDYAKTKRIVNGYIDAFKLLDTPITDSGTADLMLAFAQTIKSLGESNTQPVELLNAYFMLEKPDNIEDSKALKQRVLFATLRGNYEESYQLIDRMLSLEYILLFIDPIFDDIKGQAQFDLRQERMQALRISNQAKIKAQLAAPKDGWIFPSIKPKLDI